MALDTKWLHTPSMSGPLARGSGAAGPGEGEPDVTPIGDPEGDDWESDDDQDEDDDEEDDEEPMQLMRP